MVKVSEIEELIGLLNNLIFAIRNYEMVKEGKLRTINPITGLEVEISITQEEIEKVKMSLVNALKAVTDKINSIDWSKVE